MAAAATSKKARVTALMDRIRTCGVCDSIRDHDDGLFEDLLKICKGHPDTPRRSPKDLRIQKNRFNKLEVSSFDGKSWNSISIRACVSGKGWTAVKTVSAGLRAEIEEQILDFCKTPGNCAVCKEADGEEVDHVRPFRELRREFLEGKALSADGVAKDPVTNKPMLSDREVAEEWKTFHKEKATLQWLCKKCHDLKTAEETMSV